MRSLEEKLLAVEDLFRRGSKGYQCAVEVLMRDRSIKMNERPFICEKIGCSVKTLESALTKLRKAGLYDSPDDPPTPEETQKTQETEEQPEESRTTPKEELEPEIEVEEPEEKYVTVARFNQLVEEIRAFAGISPLQESPEMENPGYVEEQYEVPAPESVDLVTTPKVSHKHMPAWIEAKHLIFFDIAKSGMFVGALKDFNGEWSDFLNIVLDDYFTNVCTKKGPCQYRMNMGMGLLTKRFL